MKDGSNQNQDITNESPENGAVRARREFLKTCGKYAVVVPPTMALLLSRDANAAFCGSPEVCDPNSGGGI